MVLTNIKCQEEVKEGMANNYESAQQSWWQRVETSQTDGWTDCLQKTLEWHREVDSNCISVLLDGRSSLSPPLVVCFIVLYGSSGYLKLLDLTWCMRVLCERLDGLPGRVCSIAALCSQYVPRSETCCSSDRCVSHAHISKSVRVGFVNIKSSCLVDKVETLTLGVLL